jgi:hypothetical protein
LGWWFRKAVSGGIDQERHSVGEWRQESKTLPLCDRTSGVGRRRRLITQTARDVEQKMLTPHICSSFF